MLGDVTYGKDEGLEKLADQLLGGGDHKRSIERDIEKLQYEAGILSADELRHYDPVNDWDTRDSAFALLINPAEMVYVEQSICAEVGDGNVRSRNQRIHERQTLMRHVDDSEDWGSVVEDVPFLGDNGDRKLCAGCGRHKGLQYFSPDRRGRFGRDNWCKVCRTGQKRARRANKSKE